MFYKNQLHNQARIINNDRFLAYIYIAVMNNFTYFGRMGHLRVIMDCLSNIFDILQQFAFPINLHI